MVKAMRTPSSSSSEDKWGVNECLCYHHNRSCSDAPTFTGLMRIPSSTCAVSALSDSLWVKTSDSHNVLTKVVRPVPDAPTSPSVPDKLISEKSPPPNQGTSTNRQPRR